MLLSVFLTLSTLSSVFYSDTSTHDLLIGSYTKGGGPGISVYGLRPGTGNAALRYSLNSANASYLTVTADRKFMYAVKEEGSGQAATVAFVAGSDGNFTELNAVPNPGSGPCFITYREASQTVYTANYGSGSLTVFKTEKGKLLPSVQHIVYKGTSVNKARQESSHAHNVSISPDQHYLYVTDLGADKIYQHRIYSDGTVEEKFKSILVKSGSGPRHMVFDAAGTHAYLINELSGTVDVFQVNEGVFTLQQSIVADTSSAAVKGSADIHISPDGGWLLTSNRVTSNELTVFSIAKDGSLEKKGHQPVGKHPRNFTFDPDGRNVYVASRDENRVQVFSFNKSNGSLKDLGQDISLKMPVCLVFIPRVTEADPQIRLKELGVELIPPTSPIANYVKCVQTGNMVYLSGHGPDKPGGGWITGKVGKDLTIEEGQAAARLTGISLISTLKAQIGDLNRVKRIVKVLGLVNCEGSFTQQPAVMNGFSNFMVDVFGDRGRHARSAVGVVALPNNIAVEIEMIVELKQ
jgi:6-phosphogluconolactonase (cycloisomerase 2 family)/enamine deaminase RidA (YjgF/YER057c/UK114 family)